MTKWQASDRAYARNDYIKALGELEPLLTTGAELPDPAARRWFAYSAARLLALVGRTQDADKWLALGKQMDQSVVVPTPASGTATLSDAAAVWIQTYGTTADRTLPLASMWNGLVPPFCSSGLIGNLATASYEFGPLSCNGGNGVTASVGAPGTARWLRAHHLGSRGDHDIAFDGRSGFYGASYFGGEYSVRSDQQGGPRYQMSDALDVAENGAPTGLRYSRRGNKASKVCADPTFDPSVQVKYEPTAYTVVVPSAQSVVAKRRVGKSSAVNVQVFGARGRFLVVNWNYTKGGAGSCAASTGRSLVKVYNANARMPASHGNVTARRRIMSYAWR